jgi:hypothetical protein
MGFGRLLVPRSAEEHARAAGAKDISAVSSVEEAWQALTSRPRNLGNLASA